MLPFWALVFSWVLAKILREPRGWRALYAVTGMGIALHIAGDLITSYGTMILWPLSNWRAVIGTTFIIDLWFSGIIVMGLLFSGIFARSRMPSVIGIAALAGYVAFQYLQRERAIEFAEAYARANTLRSAAVTVQPRPVSPYNWTVFVSDEAAHRFAHINLVRKEAKPYRPGDGFIARVDSPYLPLDQAIWVKRARFGESDSARIEEAWQSEALGFYRWFAELPAFDGMTEKGGCVWFVDLRFVTPGRDVTPFPFGACRETPGAPWRAYERKGSGRILLR